ncbi:MAG: hypothetical protein Q9175_000539 [Cornicularia normoerica]
MFAFDATDTHFFNSHLNEPFPPDAPISAIDGLEEEKGNGRLHDNFEISDMTDAIREKSNNSSPRVHPSSRLAPEPVEPTLSGYGTPPIDIIMTPSMARSRSRAGSEHEDHTLAEATPRPLPKPLRKKKRGPKKGAVAALSTVRGFTPVTSGDDDSDFDFSSEGFRRRRDLSVQRSSSIVRKDLSLDRFGRSSIGSALEVRSSSPSSGISVLTRQLDALECDGVPGKTSLSRNKSKLGSETASSTSVTSGTSGDEDTLETASYEVHLEHDFISPDITQRDKYDTRSDTSLNGGVVQQMQATDFDPLRCLGKGTYGTVLLVKQACTGKLYAQKQFRKASLTVRKQLVEQTKTERSILESINCHPFVVKLYYAFQDHEKLYLILEYAQGGELFEHLRTERMFAEETAAFYMAEMVLALEHLHHTVGVVYRDLKPENCLLDSEGHLLLTDFGLSKEAVDGEHRCRSMTGTVEYMAPEVIQMLSYGTAVDWWSFGILGFDLLTGSSPFHANNDMKIREKIVKAKLVLPYFLSPDAKDLLTRLLRKEPKKRLGACMPKDMQSIKNHRFFRKIEWAKLERRGIEPPIKPLITDPELAENFSSEFTDLAVSPVVPGPLSGTKSEQDPFGGFSFVGSRSLLECGNGFF